ncbi:MAG TPA: hypothetical protein VKP13_14750 [Nitrospira sp.]|nr:hypothetical protein [Nitrospira sp.]
MILTYFKHSSRTAGCSLPNLPKNHEILFSSEAYSGWYESWDSLAQDSSARKEVAHDDRDDVDGDIGDIEFAAAPAPDLVNRQIHEDARQSSWWWISTDGGG